MKLWLKYVVGFFVLVIVLTGLLIGFGPSQYRDALMNAESPIGQLPADAQLAK